MADSNILFHNARLQLPDGERADGWLLVKNGIIAEMGWNSAAPRMAQSIDVQGMSLAPGFIDVHTHGALGCDTMDATPQALQTMARFFARHGVTGFLSTTMTASTIDVLAALENIASVQQMGTPGATLLGAHVEGPYVDVEKRGCQNEEYVRCADRAEYEALFDTGAVRLITLAPEFAENQALITYACDHGAAVAIGHSRASYEEVRQAVSLGASQITHLYNGLESLHHRQPGVVGAALSMDELDCQLIADNIHVHPAVLRLTVRAKSPQRILLITDAMSGTGQPDGDYTLGGLRVAVRQGVARIANGALAGSTLTMERALANIIAATDLPMHQALPMATSVPAQALGLTHKGTLALGYDADIVLLDQDLQVCLTMVKGQIVYQC